MAKNHQAQDPWKQFKQVLQQFGRPVGPTDEKPLAGGSRTDSQFSEDQGGTLGAGEDTSQPLLKTEAMAMGAIHGVMAEAKQTTGQQAGEKSESQPEKSEPSTNGEKIAIKLEDFKQSGSKRLLSDLLGDVDRQGVIFDEIRHGKGQPQKLRQVLRDRGLEKIASEIHKKKDRITLDTPVDKITISQEEHLV